MQMKIEAWFKAHSQSGKTDATLTQRRFVTENSLPPVPSAKSHRLQTSCFGALQRYAMAMQARAKS
jgi:hypothetical protein